MNVRWAIAPLATATLLAACTGEPAKPHEEVRPVRAVVAGHNTGSVGSAYSGEIVARYESQLGFRTAGKVVARLVDVGSHRQARAAPDAARPAAGGAASRCLPAPTSTRRRSRVAQARIDLQRTEQLLARQFASQAELDQQRLALDQAEAQLRSAQAQREIHANQRGFTVLTADRDGVVTAIAAEAGQVVAAGQSVVTVAARRRTRSGDQHPGVARRRAAQGADAAGLGLGAPGQALDGRAARAGARHRQRDAHLLRAHHDPGPRPRAAAPGHDGFGHRARRRRQRARSACR